MDIGEKVLLSLISTVLIVFVSAFVETIIANYIAFYKINKHTKISTDKLVWKTFWFCILSDVIGFLCSIIIGVIMTNYEYFPEITIIIMIIIISMIFIVIFSYFNILKNKIESNKQKLSFSFMLAIISAPYFSFIPYAELMSLIYDAL